MVRPNHFWLKVQCTFQHLLRVNTRRMVRCLVQGNKKSRETWHAFLPLIPVIRRPRNWMDRNNKICGLFFYFFFQFPIWYYSFSGLLYLSKYSFQKLKYDSRKYEMHVQNKFSLLMRNSAGWPSSFKSIWQTEVFRVFKKRMLKN